MKNLVYYISETQSVKTQKIDTPLGVRYLRVELYRGGTDPIEWAEQHVRPGETLLNTVPEDSAEKP